MSVIRCDNCDRLVDTDYDVEVLFCQAEKCFRTLCSSCTEKAGLETDGVACDRCTKEVTRG